jgi:AcrR family transcriptional regulator
MSVAEPTPPAPRTDRGRRRREAVIDAAAELFVEHGYLGTSVDEIGAAAGISGPGLYRHFASKDALLMAVLDQMWLALKPAIQQAAKLPPGEALDALVDAQLALALDQPDAIVLLVRELRHLPDDYRARARRNHRRYLDAWADAICGVHPDLDRDQARSVALAVHGLIDSAAIRRGRPSAEQRTQQRALLRRLAHRVLDAAGDTD